MKTKNESGSPQLLVSVRNVDEAIEAIRGGCDWLDLKEPNNGALGKPDDRTLFEVADFVRSEVIEIPLSTALGEFADFNSQLPPSAPKGFQFAKFGLSRLSDSPSWNDELCSFFSNQTFLKPVAVYYADFERADSPTIEDVMAFAIRSRASYFLVDTFHKDSTSLFDWMPPSKILKVANFCNQNEISLALAGRIQASEFAQLKGIPFNILAVRSAVCDNGDRNKAVCRNKVAEFRAKMRNEFSLRFGRDVAVTPAG